MGSTSQLQVMLGYDKLEGDLARLKREYATDDPFPHIIFDNFLDPEILREAMRQFPTPDSKDWLHYTQVNERKMAQTKRERIPPAPLAIIDEPGGGMRQSKRNEFLNIHADFTAHPHQAQWARRLYVLIYLNEDWKESYGGYLELWDRQAKRGVKKVLPVFNRCVIFSTDKDSLHGVNTLTCPETVHRKSIALYYFTSEEKLFVQSTEHRPRPEDSAFKGALIYGDKWRFVLLIY